MGIATSNALRRLFACSLALLPPGIAMAWQQAQPARPAASAATIDNARQQAAQFQQSVRAQQTRDQLRKTQAEQQLHQNAAIALRRPDAAGTAVPDQTEQAEQARNALYRARQQDLVDKYQDAVAPPVRARPRTQPAPAHSGG
ncbi:hypothetical protein [Frateuria sp. Soil773]|uniref:hypothetical protein n=1 Tax=Frateuria sp. Soil773 TaxID=1736407 RepID=UPI0012FBA7ED|nr:hypothetical protein [Frateuria sp. Soil773]